MSKDFELAKRIVLLRELKGMEQTEVAAELAKLGEISYHTYQHYEYGNHPSRRNMGLILKYYKCDKSWFLTGEGVPYPKAGDPENSAGPAYIKEGHAAWTADGPQEINIDEAWGKTYKVLKSGTPYAVALYLNIQQFSGALDATKEVKICQDSIAALQAQVDDLRRQVDGLTAPPTGADQPAVSLEKEAM